MANDAGDTGRTARTTGPEVASRRYLGHAGPVAFAHRGGAARPEDMALENSRLAFARAVDLGYRFLETDVHATRDRVVLAFHDETLDRTTTGTGEIRHQLYSEVRRALIAGREPIPTLAELLAAWPDVRWNIDVKSEQAIRPLLTVLREADAFDRVCVASFSERRLRRVRALMGSEVAVAMGPFAVAVLRFVPGAWLRRRLLPTSPCVQVPRAVPLPGPLGRFARRLGRGRGRLDVVTADFVRRAHAHGVAVHVWTVNDADTMHALLDLGVDGIITDRIDVLRDVMKARGMWTTGGT